MSSYYITNSNWIHFLQALIRQYDIYAPFEINNVLSWQKLKNDNVSLPVLDRYRAYQPIKSFLFPIKEDVTAVPNEKKIIILGLKACDLEHLKTMDMIFLGDSVKDPYYEKKRKNTILISSDCKSFAPSCFCTLMDGKPYAEQGFDMNLTSLRGGFLIDTGSIESERMVLDKKRLFQDPQPYHVKERDDIREKMVISVNKNNDIFNWDEPKNIVEKEYNSSVWKSDIAATCVECDACRFICGTCYCFILGETQEAWQKIRNWDSCQSIGYGRVAGNANPRKYRHERLRNMYTCKLVNRPKNFGFSACSGCGRCIDVCQGKIDIRKSLQTLSKGDKK